MPSSGRSAVEEPLLQKAPKEDDVDVEAGKSSATIWRLLGLAKEEAMVISVATVCMLFGSVAGVAVPRFAGQMIDACVNYTKDKGSSAGRHRVDELLFSILAILAVGAVANGLREWLFSAASERVMWRLRKRLFRNIIGQDIGFFDKTRTGELVNRLSEDTRMMKDTGTQSISNVLGAAFVAVAGLVLMFLTSWQLTVLTLAILPIVCGMFISFAILNRRYAREGLAASANAATIAEEYISAIRTVRCFAKEDTTAEDYFTAQARVLANGLRSARLNGCFLGFIGAVAQGSIVVVLWYGSRRVIAGQLSPGDLSAFILYAIYVGSSVGSVAREFSSLVKALGASERVFQLLDRVPAMPPSGKEKPLGTSVGGEIRMEDVWFAYPTRPDIDVLRGITLHVPPGWRVALVGPSGGGKSTVMALLERLYDPQRGRVLLDGVPLPQVDHMHLHRQVSIVSQEPILFAQSIAANIMFGVWDPKSPPDMAAVRQAAVVANAHDFISTFPEGYDTIVGERGVRLSGGQKQRIAIARAVLMQPRVLLLDEATSALDAESEALVQEALDRVAHGRTVLVIAHRLSTVQGADQVVVVADGKVAEQGGHAQLLHDGGMYATLVRRQLLGASPAPSHLNLASMAPDNTSDTPTANTASQDG